MLRHLLSAPPALRLEVLPHAQLCSVLAAPCRGRPQVQLGQQPCL